MTPHTEKALLEWMENAVQYSNNPKLFRLKENFKDSLLDVEGGAPKAEKGEVVTPKRESGSFDIPRRPWVLSKQYSMTFLLSQDNEIILGTETCKTLGDDTLNFIIAAVNNWKTAWSSPAPAPFQAPVLRGKDDYVSHTKVVAQFPRESGVREVLPGEQESHDQEQYENACKCPKCGTWVIYFKDERGEGVECAHLECDWIAKVAAQVPLAQSELDRQRAVSINDLEAEMKVYKQALSQWHIKAVELRADLDRANGSLNQIAEAFGLSKESNEALVIHAEKLADNAGGELKTPYKTSPLAREPSQSPSSVSPSPEKGNMGTGKA